jgi:hypothetical protein
VPVWQACWRARQLRSVVGFRDCEDRDLKAEFAALKKDDGDLEPSFEVYKVDVYKVRREALVLERPFLSISGEVGHEIYMETSADENGDIAEVMGMGETDED